MNKKRIKRIKRKTLLYKTGVEYGDFTMNHVLGCSHGCLYPCYAYLIKKRFGLIKSYDDWIQPKLVINTLELLDKEIPKYKKNIKSVQLCFATDPFMVGYKEIQSMSIRAIEKLNDNGIKCVVLTKGILPKKLAEYSKKNEYGITLVSLNEKYRKTVEPGTSPYKKRVEALKYLHNKGFKTWVSIEPYPSPNMIEQNIEDILQEIKFVDKIVFGRINYNKHVSEYKDYKHFYNVIAKNVKTFCKQNNIKCIIKKGTISSVKSR